MFHVTTTGAYYPPVVTTEASYLITGTLCSEALIKCEQVTNKEANWQWAPSCTPIICRKSVEEIPELEVRNTSKQQRNVTQTISDRENTPFSFSCSVMYPPTTFALGPIQKPYRVYLHQYLNLDRLCLHILKRITPKIIKSNLNSDSTPFRLSPFTFALFKKGRAEITIVPPYKGCGEADDK